MKYVKNFLDRHPLFKGIILSLLQKRYPIFIDYPIDSKPRYGYGKPPHAKLEQILGRNYQVYQESLQHILECAEDLKKIKKYPSENKLEPYWINGWLSGLDAASLYGFIAQLKPRRYIEIGSGNSTKFARHAILARSPNTRITSIDPYPRAEIDQLCDRVIRKKLEDCPLDIFDELQENDILFVDNSHRLFMNSDVAVFFLDILPRLKKGVLVQIHDILLPYDYPPEWIQRYYSEQYLLAAHLLAEGSKTTVLFPGNFISCDPELSKILAPLWSLPEFEGVETRGGCFWLRVN